MDSLDDDPPKTSRATIVRRAIVAVLAVACAGGWIYTRYLVDKKPLGGNCSYDMHCLAEAPRCLKSTADGDGVCSRPCDDDADCATDIQCVKVEIEERDEQGKPVQAGYCFPKALLDARRKKPDGGSPQAVKTNSWIDVPQAPGQLEGEVVLELGSTRTTYEIKGTLVMSPSAKHGRTIVDTSSLRVYTVNDDKGTFYASQIGAGTDGSTVTKTTARDTIAGRACEVWRIEGDKTNFEACVILGAAFVAPTTRVATPWERELATRGAFPLRVTEGNKTKLVAVKFDERPVEGTRFEIPKRYKNVASR